MLHESSVRDLVDDLLEEEALAIGGLAALGCLNDETVERLLGSLAVIRERTMRRVGGAQEAMAPVERRAGGPHPAIEAFLAKLGRR